LTNLERELAKLTIKMSQMKAVVARRALQRGQAALGRPETKDRTSWTEPHIAGLRTAIADGSAKVEEVRREAAGLIAQPWDCCPKVNQDLTNPEQELAKLKEGMREFRVLNAAMADQWQRREPEICDLKHEVKLLWKMSDGQSESQERETPAAEEVRKLVWQIEGARTQNGRHGLGVGEVARANDRLRAAD
jgi:DNA repair exonuclease SbcCD ATPase subunit